LKYRIEKTMSIDSGHQLHLDYPSPCAQLHGHTYHIIVTVEGDTLNRNGMLIDFTHIKDVIKAVDHQMLNYYIPYNPTAENIARWIAEQVQQRINDDWTREDQLPGCQQIFEDRPLVTEVEVNETAGNHACYTP